LLFRKSIEDYIRSGDKHLKQACNLQRDFKSGELQKAIGDYSKAFELFLKVEGKYEGRYLGVPHLRFDWPYQSCIFYYYKYPFRKSAKDSYDKGDILARRALALFLGGQYDKSMRDVANVGFSSSVNEADLRLLQARIYSAKGSYEDALVQCSNMMRRDDWKRLGGYLEIEKAALECNLGHFYEASSLLDDYLWPMPTKFTDSEVSYVASFEEDAQRKTQEALFPLNTEGPVQLIFFIALRSHEASPIITIRKSVELANVAIEVTRHVGGENKATGGPGGRELNCHPLPFLTGVMFALRATSEQAAGFVRQMRSHFDIEQLECFGVFSDSFPFKPVSDEEHMNLMLELAEKRLVFGQYRWYKGGCARSQSTVLREEEEHNDAVKKSGYCPKCRRVSGKYESVMV